MTYNIPPVIVITRAHKDYFRAELYCNHFKYGRKWVCTICATNIDQCAKDAWVIYENDPCGWYLLAYSEELYEEEHRQAS